jgi:uncharacterized protein (DUF58 family)
VFSRIRWLPIMGMILILGIILRVQLLVALPAALFVVLGVATWWQKHSLDGVKYRRYFHYTRAFPGESVALRVEVENRKILPLSWLRIQDPWPKAIGPEDENILAPSHIPDRGYLTNVYSLRWFERARRAYHLLFRKRGVYQVGPARIDSGDLFGFFEKAEEGDDVNHLTVFPSLLKLQDIDLPAEDPFGERRSRRRLFEDPNRPMGVREYRPEDSFRRVHWPATARTGQLQVKVYQPTSGQVMLVCLNVSTFTRHWEGVYPELLEHIIEVAATLVSQGIEDGYKVGLIANGCLAHADQSFRIPPGRSPQQLSRLLEALAGVTPVVTIPFERFLLREAPRMPYGATLLILTAITTPELAEVIMKLKRHERRITLLSLGKEPPTVIPGVHIIHRPFQETE